MRIVTLEEHISFPELAIQIPNFTPVWLSPTDKNYSSIHTIAPFRFTNQC